MIKDLICKAFCQSLDVRNVPIGYTVGMPYENADGDQLRLYFVRGSAESSWHIEDDGTQIPLLEAYGVDLSGRARGDAFQAILAEYGASYDKDEKTLQTRQIDEQDIGTAAVKFSAMLLRLQDLALLSPQIVRNTWREDAISLIHQTFDRFASVEESKPLSPELAGQEADVVIKRADSSSPLAIYLGTSEERALHAIIAKMDAEKYRHIDGNVALLVERVKKNPVRDTTYSLAHARLDAVLSFRESTQESLDRIGKLVGVSRNQLLQ